MNQNLRNFPFDLQTNIVKFGTPSWSDDAIHLEDITARSTLDHFKDGIDLTEWKLVRRPRVESLVEFNFEDERNISYIAIHIDLRRRSEFYLFYIVALIFLCDVLLWCIFFVNPDSLSDRLSLMITLFLALVALNFAVAELLPKVSYTTKLTQYFVVNYACISLSGIQCVVNYHINKIVCQIEPGNAPCNLTLAIDWATVSILAVGQIVYTLFFVYLGLRADAKALLATELVKKGQEAFKKAEEKTQTDFVEQSEIQKDAPANTKNTSATNKTSAKVDDDDDYVAINA